MPCKDLREFIALLEKEGDLIRIKTEVDPNLEITEICDRTLRAGGPALLFENPRNSKIPLLGNLFGHPRRVALAMGQKDLQGLRDVGHLLAFLKEPVLPKGWKELWQNLPAYRQVLNIAPDLKKTAPCRDVFIDEADIDLGMLPVQTCWPGDVGPLVTWPLVITRGPEKERQNLGIYRMQVIGRNKMIMRWLSHRGGALDFRDWQIKHPGEPFPWRLRSGPTRPRFWPR